MRLWPFSRKASPTSRLIILGLNITGPIQHKDFKTLARQSFERNATVFACVSEIARACSTVPWVLYELGSTRTSKTRRVLSSRSYRAAECRSHDTRRWPTLVKTLEQTEIEDHPLLKLLEQPNAAQAQAEYTEQLLSFWLISGNGYQQFIAPNRKGAPPLEIWNLRPDRVEIVPSESPAIGLVGGYRYTVANESDTFDPASVIHHKFFHPTDDFYGLSPLQAAARAWQSGNLAADWNASLIAQGARPSGAIVAPTTVADDVYERLKKEVDDSYSGALAAGRSMFLEGGMKWEPMGLTPLELDFLAGLKDADVRICRVFHLPPELIGIPDGRQYNSFSEARMSFWQEANLPLLDRLRDSYNQRLTPRFGDRLYLDYDRDQIDAIQEEQAKVWDKLNRTRFLSTNEKRQAAGYSTYDDPLANVPEFLLNPTPGATGIVGAPANAPSSLRSIEQFLQQAVAESDLSPEQKASAVHLIAQRLADSTSQYVSSQPTGMR